MLKRVKPRQPLSRRREFAYRPKQATNIEMMRPQTVEQIVLDGTEVAGVQVFRDANEVILSLVTRKGTANVRLRIKDASALANIILRKVAQSRV